MENFEISEKIRCLEINECYQREVFGLGEVYEIISVEKIRKKLLKKFPQGTLYLASNKNHGSRGLSLQDLENHLSSHFEILGQGYADSPPWSSKPLGANNKKNYNPITVSLAKLVFFCLIRFERWWECPERSHMIYCLVKKL